MKCNKYQRKALQLGDNLTMKLNKYQDGAVSTAIYPGKLIYPALGLCGEVAELVEVVTITEDSDAVPKEMGDVLWYIANVAADLGLDLKEVAGVSRFEQIEPANVDYWVMPRLVVLAGKVAENVKKTIRDHDGVMPPNRIKTVVESLREMLTILTALALWEETTLTAAAKANLDKLQSRAERGKLTGDGGDR